MNAHTFRPMLRRRNLVALTAFSLLSLVACFGFAASGAQTDAKEEREVVERIPKHLPIKVKVKKPERLKDAQNEEWLGELEVEVTNTGTKPIYYLHISVSLPDVFAPNGRNFGFPIRYGRNRLVALDEPVRPDDVPLKPGEIVVLKVPADRAELWRRGRAEGDRANPRKIELIFNYLNFGDGTGFVGGKPLPEVKERGANVTCPGAAATPSGCPPHTLRGVISRTWPPSAGTYWLYSGRRARPSSTISKSEAWRSVTCRPRPSSTTASACTRFERTRTTSSSSPGRACGGGCGGAGGGAGCCAKAGARELDNNVAAMTSAHDENLFST